MNLDIDINIDDPIDLCELVLQGIVIALERSTVEESAQRFGDDLFPKIVGGVEKLFSWRGRRVLRKAVRQGVDRLRKARAAERSDSEEEIHGEE